MKITFFRPIIPLLISLIAGIVIGEGCPGHAIIAFGIFAFLVLLLLYSLFRGDPDGYSPKPSKGDHFAATVLHRGRQGLRNPGAPLVLFAVLGYLSIQPWVIPGFSSDHVIHFADGEKANISGIVHDRPRVFQNRMKFILEIHAIQKDGRSRTVRGNVGVTVLGATNSPSVGETVTFTGILKKIRNFANPNGFDYQRYMAFQGVWVTSFVTRENMKVSARASATGFNACLENIRGWIAHHIETAVPVPQSALLKSLVIGDRDSISPELREAFNRAGVGHLLAISGLHMGIVAMTAFFCFSGMLSISTGLLWRAWVKKGAALLTLLPVLVYLLLSGVSPSSQRAALMVTVFLLSFLFEREQDPINTLAAAALLILIVDPPALFSISFQLSFVAVFSIIHGLSIVGSLRTGNPRQFEITVWRRWRRKFMVFVWVSFFAVLGTLPLTLYYFNQVSLVGIAANVILVPLVGFTVVPLALFSAFMMPFSAGAATFGFQFSGLLLEYALRIIFFFSDLSFAAVKAFTPTPFEIVLFYLFGWTVSTLFSRGPSPPDSVRNVITVDPNHFSLIQRNSSLHPWRIWGRVTAVSQKFYRIFEYRVAHGQRRTLIIGLLVLLAGASDAVFWLHHRFWHEDLRVTIIDVGQGGSALIETPGGKTILVDGGGFADNAVFDVGARLIAPLLWRKKIQTVDTLVLSHPNSDHLNGLLYIAEHFNVKRVWTNGDVAETLSYRRFLEIVRRNAIEMPAFDALARKYHVNGISLEILYPLDHENRNTSRGRLNQNGIVLKVRYGSVSFLFPGDIEAVSEKKLVAAWAGNALRSTVLVAAHHGSKTSNSEVFLDRVKPEIVIISSGWRNRYGFPHSMVVERFVQQGCRLFNTANDGAVIMTTDGKSLKVQTVRVDKNECFRFF